MPEIYQPREDTYLILNEVKRLATGNVLDIGTGSGILAMAAALKAENVIGTDVNKDALEFARKSAQDYGLINIQFHYSDLFSYFNQNPWKFDLIIFNPPYLPEDLREPEESRLATTGGKKGYELLERFFSQASEFLMPYGKILVLFSSLTGQDKVHEVIENYGFNYQKISEEGLFAETLFVYLAEKSELLRLVEMHGITNVQKIAKGHRGFIYTGRLNKKKIVIKQQRQDKPVVGRIANEARWLKLLNRHKIGPKFLYFEDNYFVYEYVSGENIILYLQNGDKAGIKKVLTEIFNQCFELDKLKINKEEMHNPYKHILVKNNKPTMIDFERTHITDKPKNVTQFCQFITSKKILNILKEKGFKFNRTQITTAAKNYKKEINKENLKEILEIIK